MNLVIDYGNSVIKAAVFENGQMIEKAIFKEDPEHNINRFIHENPAIENAILSASSTPSESFIKILKDSVTRFILLDHTTPLPIKNLYESKTTLGYDRISSAIGAYTICPGCNVLVIDAGTAITIDILNSNAEFIGGNISPGREMRARAMNSFTARLPLVETTGDYPLTGKNTEEALKAGIMNGIKFELEGYIGVMNKKYENLQVFLTGGDAKYFVKNLNYAIFADSNINLLGLNSILNYNAK